MGDVIVALFMTHLGGLGCKWVEPMFPKRNSPAEANKIICRSITDLPLVDPNRTLAFKISLLRNSFTQEKDAWLQSRSNHGLIEWKF